MFGYIEKLETKEVVLYKSAFQAMINLESDQSKFAQLKESLNIMYVLAFYLISIFPFCSQEFFKEYFILGYMLLRAINEKGKHFIKSNEDILRVKLDNKKFICETDQITIISEIMNLFLAELYPSYFKELNEKLEFKFEFIGFEDEHIKNLILMNKFLAN